MYIEDVLKYLNTEYSQNIKFIKTLLPFSDLKKEIDNNSPVVIDLENHTNTDGKHNHAITMIGYTMTADGDTSTYPPYYTYWNPWWSEIFMVSSKSEKLVLDNYVFKPYRTTYNFHIKLFYIDEPNNLTMVYYYKIKNEEYFNESINKISFQIYPYNECIHWISFDSEYNPRGNFIPPLSKGKFFSKSYRSSFEINQRVLVGSPFYWNFSF
ncbi:MULTISPECIES: hypothetical protein [unclassified Enterococcus]|uniref:hypothetical protein n=1 Tax=unclassified Enterococcus TaxID=2608891 RepID=UPI0013EB6EBA|nr:MULTISPECIES: hypothetical protein [unclassified Enterococcus]